MNNKVANYLLNLVLNKGADVYIFKETYLHVKPLNTSVNDIVTEFKQNDINVISEKGEIIIEIDNLPFLCYENKEVFLNACNNVDSFNLFEKDILLLKYLNNETLFCEKTEDNEYVTYVNVKVCKDDFFIENVYYYLKTLNFFATNQFTDIKTPYLIDYYNISDRKLIVSSKSNIGNLMIGYPDVIPEFDVNVSIKDRCEKLYELFEPNKFENKRLFPDFFKKELFNQLYDLEIENRYKIFIEKLDVICQHALLNYDTYSLDFSFDNFTKEFKEKKNKYFEAIRNVFSNVLKQAISLPLTITAAAFATYKMNNNEWIQVFIILSFIAYTIYIAYIIGFFKKDIVILEKEFEEEFVLIEKSDFIISHKNDLINTIDGKKCTIESVLNYDKNSIINRLRDSKRGLNIYLVVTIILNSLFAIYTIIQIFRGAIVLNSLCCFVFKLLFLLIIK